MRKELEELLANLRRYVESACREADKETDAPTIQYFRGKRFAYEIAATHVESILNMSDKEGEVTVEEIDQDGHVTINLHIHVKGNMVIGK